MWGQDIGVEEVTAEGEGEGEGEGAIGEAFEAEDAGGGGGGGGGGGDGGKKKGKSGGAKKKGKKARGGGGGGGGGGGAAEGGKAKKCRAKGKAPATSHGLLFVYGGEVNAGENIESAQPFDTNGYGVCSTDDLYMLGG